MKSYGIQYVGFKYLNGYAMFSVSIVKQLCYVWICFAAVLRKNDPSSNEWVFLARQ